MAACVKAAVSARGVVIVHGGGRAIDAELARRGLGARKVDGLRITDAATLEAVVSVLAGSANTDLVAALVGEGIQAVGLTGVDAAIGRAVRSSAHRTADGALVDLGFVGDPIESDASLVRLLVGHRYVPVIASIGLDRDAEAGTAQIVNVNADVMACRLAAAFGNCDLVIAGATPGVFDGRGVSIGQLDTDGINDLIAAGTATAGMIAKLSACRTALLNGVSSVRIVDGRGLDGSHGVTEAPGTSLTLATKAQQAGTLVPPF
jgi:acetylglutamate kinase